jgi:hypothetical protein
LALAFVAKALVATFCIVCSVDTAAELRALAVIHRLLIHRAALKWLLHVDQVVALAQAVALKSLLLVDQAVALDQAVEQKLLPHAELQAVALKAHAVHLALLSFRP